MRWLIKNHSGKLIASVVLLFIAFLGYHLMQSPGEDIEAKFIYLLKDHGYTILFAWSVFEGEIGLIMGGLLCHTGDLWVPYAIFVAGLGAFTGDMVAFLSGRYNKAYIHRKLISQRRKFALAHLLVKRYGWPIIFLQRYIYGMRTIIPVSIGLTGFSAKKFAMINILAGWLWASITIIPVWYFGEHILEVLEWAKQFWYLALPMAILFIASVLYYFHVATRKVEKKLTKEI